MIDARDTTPRDDVLTVQEAADLARVSTDVIYAAVKAGILPKLRLPGRTIRIIRGDFDLWLRGGRDVVGEAPPSVRQQKELLKGTKRIVARR